MSAGVRVAADHDERVLRAAHPVVLPALRAVGRRGPVVRVPGLGVVVSDAALVREALLDTEALTKTGPGSPSDLWTPVLGPAVLLNMEGEAHGALRSRLGGLFTPRAVAALVDDALGERVGAFGSRLRAGEAVDVVPVVADLAGAVICRMTGLPADDPTVRAAFTGAQEIVGMVRLHRRGLTRRQVARARAVLATLAAPAAEAYRAGDPATVPGRMRDLGLTEQEALGAIGAFVLTGTETVVAFVPRLLAHLADTGWARRCADLPDDDPWTQRFVEEVLRVTTPSPAMLRSVVRPRRLDGVELRPGDRVVLATLLACQGAGPLDPDRPQDPAVRRLWFGAGAHYCLGMPLAMAEIRAVLAATLDALRAAPAADLRVVERQVARGVLIPAYRRLVVKVS